LSPRPAARLLLALVALSLGWPAFAPRARAEGVGAAPLAASVCDQVAAVPASECAALVEFYDSTGGPTWINATNWLSLASPASPCDWRGVACAGGHVTALELGANRLTGPLPPSIAALPSLTRLGLANNRLRGSVPPTVCALASRGGSADLAYNALETRRSDTRACLIRIDSDWAATQTVAPRGLLPTAFEPNAIQLSWNPIPYDGDGGYYQVGYATDPDGPFTIHGRTADRAASSYLLDGLAPGTTYFVQVRSVTPPHGEQPDELRSDEAQTIAVTRGAQRVLLIVYLPADNDLAPYVPPIIERLRFGTRLNPNAQVVVLSDRAAADDTTVVTIAGGVVSPSDAVFERWGVRELDTASADVLAWFLRYARERFPSEREIVSLMGHGIALVPEVAWPDVVAARAEGVAGAPARIPALPKGDPATPGDVTDRGFLSTVGLGRALAQATDGGARPFDLLFLDQCFQGNLDTLYELRAAADNFIASPNYAWLAAPYDQYLPLLAPSADNVQIGIGIIARYERNLNDRHPNAIFGLGRVTVDAVAAATSELGGALQAAVRGGDRERIATAVIGAQYVDTTQCGRQNLTLGPPDQLIGLGTLAANLQAQFGPGDRYGVHAAAQRALDALGGIYKRSRSGSPYIAPGELWDYTDSITVLAPLPPRSPSAVAWRSSVYTETVPLAATWTPSPTLAISVTASFAFVRDGGWDEFLAEWYGEPLAPTIGDWCHYIPPALVAPADVEALALSAMRATGDAAQLAWTPSAQDGVAGYRILAKGPFDIALGTRAIIPPAETTARLGNLEANAAYQVQVVAEDEAGVVLAQSNMLTVTAGSANLYLPLVAR
jgi:hypothetical protein